MTLAGHVVVIQDSKLWPMKMLNPAIQPFATVNVKYFSPIPLLSTIVPNVQSTGKHFVRLQADSRTVNKLDVNTQSQVLKVM